MKAHLKAELKKIGVSVVYLFGSKATGRTSRLSDVDIGIVLEKSPCEEDTRALSQSLYEIFTEIYPASKLDIVLLQTASLALQYFAIKDGKIIFEEDPRFTADYENRVINQYLDFRPVLDMFDRVAMKRYAKA
jgi:predicted nucleotidyltransferase